MPSVILTAASGLPFPLMSGNVFSGQGSYKPYSQIYLANDFRASGNAYISLSGGATITSGGFLLSGLNSDAIGIAPGRDITLPKVAIGPSGQLNIYASCDAAASGVARLYFEIL